MNIWIIIFYLFKNFLGQFYVPPKQSQQVNLEKREPNLAQTGMINMILSGASSEDIRSNYFNNPNPADSSEMAQFFGNPENLQGRFSHSNYILKF